MKRVNDKQNYGGWSEDHLFAKFAVAFTSALRYAHFSHQTVWIIYYYTLEFFISIIFISIKPQNPENLSIF